MKTYYNEHITEEEEYEINFFLFFEKYEVLLTLPHGTRRMTGRQSGKKYPSSKREGGALAPFMGNESISVHVFFFTWFWG